MGIWERLFGQVSKQAKEPSTVATVSGKELDDLSESALVELLVNSVENLPARELATVYYTNFKNLLGQWPRLHRTANEFWGEPFRKKYPQLIAAIPRWDILIEQDNLDLAYRLAVFASELYLYEAQRVMLRMLRKHHKADLTPVEWDTRHLIDEKTYAILGQVCLYFGNVAKKLTDTSIRQEVVNEIAKIRERLDELRSIVPDAFARPELFTGDSRANELSMIAEDASRRCVA